MQKTNLLFLIQVLVLLPAFLCLSSYFCLIMIFHSEVFFYLPLFKLVLILLLFHLVLPLQLMLVLFLLFLRCVHSFYLHPFLILSPSEFPRSWTYLFFFFQFQYIVSKAWPFWLTNFISFINPYEFYFKNLSTAFSNWISSSMFPFEVYFWQNIYLVSFFLSLPSLIGKAFHPVFGLQIYMD